MLPDNRSEWPETPSATPQTVQQRQSSHSGAMAALIVGVALFGVLIGIGVDRWAITNLSAKPPGAAVATALASDPAQQAIQQVIQRGDDEQAQAFANNDPSVMQDTSTRRLLSDTGRCQSGPALEWCDRHQVGQHRVGPGQRQRHHGHGDGLRDVDDDLLGRHDRAVARSQRIHAGSAEWQLGHLGGRAPGR